MKKARSLRPVPNVVLLPCRTLSKVSRYLFIYLLVAERRLKPLSWARLNLVRHDYLARYALPCRTAVARLGFKRRSNVAPN